VVYLHSLIATVLLLTQKLVLSVVGLVAQKTSIGVIVVELKFVSCVGMNIGLMIFTLTGTILRTSMPKVNQATETPQYLRPYEFLGLELTYKAGDKDAYADCIYCEREGKMGIKVETGQFRCNVCEEKGNIRVFMQKLQELSFEATTTQDYKELAANRKLYTDETLIHWQLGKSILTGDWLIPGWNVEGKLTGLYRYIKNGDRMMLMPTPTLGHHLLGMNLFDKQCAVLYVCEGSWDSMCLWETLRLAKPSGEGYVATSNPQASLLADANVIGVPSASVFYENWCDLLGGKTINLMAQNDHERIHSKTKKRIAPASYEGMLKIHKMLLQADHPPESVNMIFWGDKGWTEELPTGYDVRDMITS